MFTAKPPRDTPTAPRPVQVPKEPKTIALSGPITMALAMAITAIGGGVASVLYAYAYKLLHTP